MAVIERVLRVKDSRCGPARFRFYVIVTGAKARERGRRHAFRHPPEQGRRKVFQVRPGTPPLRR